MTRTALLFTLLALLTAALFVADLAVGSVYVSPGEIWGALTGKAGDPALQDIVLKIRLLKAVTALAAGAALAASGLEMQTLFRNPLAGPYVLGVSSGASLGVALFLLGAPLLGVSGHTFVQSLGIAGAAWLGAALVLAAILAVSRRIKDIMVILILGMMLVTYIPRMLPAVLLEKLHFGPKAEKFLQLVPYTAMAALIFPGILTMDAARPYIGLAGGAAAGLLAWKRVPVIVCVLAAVAVDLALYVLLP